MRQDFGPTMEDTLSSLEETNDERELLNFELTHLHNLAKHKGVTLNPVVNTSVLQEDLAEYGVMLFDENGNKRATLKFSSLERCQRESDQRPGSVVVRLGRNHRCVSMDVLYTSDPPNTLVGPFVASTDESGNIETLDEDVVPSQNSYQLISNELIVAGYYQGSRPPAEFLRNLAMRYNDIVPEEFAAAVIKHCEVPKVSEVGENLKGKSTFKSFEEKSAWYSTPAGKQWTKEHPIPSIFTLPTPEYIHRRG